MKDPNHGIEDFGRLQAAVALDQFLSEAHSLLYVVGEAGADLTSAGGEGIPPIDSWRDGLCELCMLPVFPREACQALSAVERLCDVVRYAAVLSSQRSPATISKHFCDSALILREEANRATAELFDRAPAFAVPDEWRAGCHQHLAALQNDLRSAKQVTDAVTSSPAAKTTGDQMRVLHQTATGMAGQKAVFEIFREFRLHNDRISSSRAALGSTEVEGEMDSIRRCRQRGRLLSASLEHPLLPPLMGMLLAFMDAGTMHLMARESGAPQPILGFLDHNASCALSEFNAAWADANSSIRRSLQT